jgi:hypothetical protein
MRVQASSLLAGVVISACGLEREPGPSPNEFGGFFFWQVSGEGQIDLSDACGPEPLAPPDLPPNSYLVYQVSEDGKSATAQDCERVQASSCKRSDVDLVFDVKGHTLSAQTTEAAEPITDTCDNAIHFDWTVIDEGTTADFSVSVKSVLSGDCEDVEPLPEPPCTAKLQVPMKFDRIDWL